MSWTLYKQYSLHLPQLGFSLDCSRMGVDTAFIEAMSPKLQKALDDSRELERGGFVNIDEHRQVGHYWLRAPERAPNATLKQAIEDLHEDIQAFTQAIHQGHRVGATGPFRYLLCIGIGGSALGPQLVAAALGKGKADKLVPYFIDNTDPDGIDQVLDSLEGSLGQTLCIISSKSGSTPEPRNAMLEVELAYKQAKLNFADHALAITSSGSQLDQYAKDQKWLKTFPMWDWVGGRTSELAAVGLVPAALQGIDIHGLLAGAKAMDAQTRIEDVFKNPALLLALAWYKAGEGIGKKAMVLLPYKDRLLLLSRYLQQLIMESLGKAVDLQGTIVHQGITVYGNKGSTDQHAYVQQLRDGLDNFFVTFIEVLKDREGVSPDIEPETTSGDYLQAFLLGTQEALSEKGRLSCMLTIRELSPFSIGLLIALYERAVSFYASFININAYHQPGVEAGKKAAASFLSLKKSVIAYLKAQAPAAFTAEAIATALSLKEDPKEDPIDAVDPIEAIYKLLKHAVANPQARVFERESALFWETQFYYQA